MTTTARFTPHDPPRTFHVGPGASITLRDCGRVALAADEQVTFVTEGGAEHDVVRTAWGFYATPSLNHRLPQHGLRPALVRSETGRFYIVLVERHHDAEFGGDLERERHRVVAWLDDAATLDDLDRRADSRSAPCLCGARTFVPVFTYAAPPPGEVRLPSRTGQRYRREVLRCGACGHFVAEHAMDLSDLYREDYVTSTYGEDGLGAAFARISALPPSRSDNHGRIRRVLEFAAARLAPRRAAPTLLDVGSGLAVFVHGMRSAGWRCTALDPDPRAARHAGEVVGVEAACGDFMTLSGLGTFDVVSFNKVLEHVLDPVAMLARARGHLGPGGFAYVEVPDGETAASHGPEREEFFVDHWHAFSAASTAILAARAGFALAALERLREPSGKFTLRAFLEVAGR